MALRIGSRSQFHGERDMRKNTDTFKIKVHLTKEDMIQPEGNYSSPKGDWSLWYNLTLNKRWWISIHQHFWQDAVPSGCGQTWKGATANLQHMHRSIPLRPHFMITNQFSLMCPIFHCSIFVSVPLSVITSSEHLSAPFTKLLFFLLKVREYKAVQFCRTKEERCYLESPAQMAFIFLTKQPHEVFCQ